VLYHSHVLGIYDQFFNRYTNWYSIDGRVKIPKSYKNQEQLAETIDDFTLYVDKNEVLDLPEQQFIKRTVAMTPELRVIYKQLEDEMVAEIGEDLLVASNRLVQGLRLHQLTSGYYPTEEGELRELDTNPKLDELMELVDEIGHYPFVVFTRFRQDVLLISRAFKAAGIDTRLLVGGTYQHDEWQAGAGQALIANIQAGNAGIKLTRARYFVYYSVGHSRTDYTQSLSRGHRPGADLNHPVTYYQLAVDGTIDTEIWRGLEGKGQMSDYLLQELTNAIRSKST
jgi:SNF2 family DNA or RNA helicase